MADNAGTSMAAGGTEGAAAQPTGFTAPAEWAEVETYKPFFVEKDGAKIFDVPALAKSYADTKALIPVVPAKADDYKFEFPKGLQIDEAKFNLEREAAKNLGLTQAQFEGLHKHAIAEYVRVSEAVAAEGEKVKAELTREWGGPQKFEENKVKVEKAAELFFGKDVFKQEVLQNNPVIMRGLLKIATKLSEDTLKIGTGAGADNRPIGLDGRPMLRFPSMEGK
jgi:hypothetical protein